jgi:hypothetical protein
VLKSSLWLRRENFNFGVDRLAYWYIKEVMPSKSRAGMW